jgi:hypothetical protein
MLTIQAVHLTNLNWEVAKTKTKKKELGSCIFTKTMQTMLLFLMSSFQVPSILL